MKTKKKQQTKSSAYWIQWIVNKNKSTMLFNEFISSEIYICYSGDHFECFNGLFVSLVKRNSERWFYIAISREFILMFVPNSHSTRYIFLMHLTAHSLDCNSSGSASDRGKLVQSVARWMIFHFTLQSVNDLLVQRPLSFKIVCLCGSISVVIVKLERIKCEVHTLCHMLHVECFETCN